jgi:hypothetical protein
MQGTRPAERQRARLRCQKFGWDRRMGERVAGAVRRERVMRGGRKAGRPGGGCRTSGDVELDGLFVWCAPFQRRRIGRARVGRGLQRAPHRVNQPRKPVVGVVDGAVRRAAHEVPEQRAKRRVDRAARLEQRVPTAGGYRRGVQAAGKGGGYKRWLQAAGTCSRYSRRS